MIRLITLTVLAAAVSVANPAAISSEHDTNNVTMWCCDEAAVTPEATIPDAEAPTFTNDDNATEDNDGSIDESRKPRKNRCRADADCGLGYLCYAGVKLALVANVVLRPLRLLAGPTSSNAPSIKSVARASVDLQA
ncbi:hypothetical protein BBP40_010108 [Aspergillus hancockii]|nr:hypothetical protein BBP40_010108 [Aspergillus hancockii]